jgi:hypothetical protein
MTASHRATRFAEGILPALARTDVVEVQENVLVQPRVSAKPLLKGLGRDVILARMTDEKKSSFGQGLAARTQDADRIKFFSVDVIRREANARTATSWRFRCH